MTTVELPEGWATAPLGLLLEDGGLFDGPFGSSLKTSDYTPNGVRVIRLENISTLRFNEDKHTYISSAKYATLTKHTVNEGDIIVGSFVDGAMRVCVLPALPTNAIAKADCFCVRTRQELVDRRFVAFQLGANKTRDALVEEVHGATRPRITTQQLRECELLIAPLAEQLRIVAKVEALLDYVTRVQDWLDRVAAILTVAGNAEKRLSGVTGRVGKVTQAILSKAFAGELVPTEAELARAEGRSYETAEKLLTRIRIRLGNDTPEEKSTPRKRRASLPARRKVAAGS